MPSRQSLARTRANMTALLKAWQQRHPDAAERRAPLVYNDLRRLARQQLRREGHAPTLRPTELVHETYGDWRVAGLWLLTRLSTTRMSAQP